MASNNNNHNSNNNDTAVIYLPITAIKEDQQYSSLLPSIDADEYKELKDDIMLNGLKVPLIINDNNILLDGYTRLRIARELQLKEVPCIVKTFNDRLEEELYILTVNYHRRHLNTWQKGRLILRIMEKEKEISERKKLMNLKQFKGKNNNGNRKMTEIGSPMTDLPKCINDTHLAKQDKQYNNDDNNSNSNIASDTEVFPGNTSGKRRDKLTKRYHISSKTLTKIKKIEEVAEKDPEIAELCKKKRSIDSVYRRVIEKEARTSVRPIVEEGKVKAEDLAKVTILHGDFREVLKDIPSDSIDLIFTDPPYSEKHLDLVKDLFLLASRVLKPSGYLAIMYGQNHLDEFFKVFESCNSNNKGNNTKLRYYWAIAMHMPNGQELFYPKNAIIRWKPIFIFQKEPFIVLEHRFEDYISRPKPNKDVHEWRQDLESAIHVISSFSKEGDAILDPMVGTGRTIEACLMLKRRCIAVEKDKELCEMLLRRFSYNNKQ